MLIFSNFLYFIQHLNCKDYSWTHTNRKNNLGLFQLIRGIILSANPPPPHLPICRIFGSQKTSRDLCQKVSPEERWIHHTLDRYAPVTHVSVFVLKYKKQNIVFVRSWNKNLIENNQQILKHFATRGSNFLRFGGEFGRLISFYEIQGKVSHTHDVIVITQ